MTDTQVTWLTPESHERLKHELDALIANRPVIAAEINERREEGDLKENGGYHAARDEQGQQEARIRQLQELLNNAKVGEAPTQSGVALPGSVVKVYYDGDEKDVETFLAEPALFDAYAAVSPSLWWDKERLSQRAAGLLTRQGPDGPRLYLTIADEGTEMQAGMDRLVTALRSRPEQADRFCYAPRPRSTHGTIYHDVSPEALQYLFPTDVAHETASGFTRSQIA